MCEPQCHFSQTYISDGESEDGDTDFDYVPVTRYPGFIATHTYTAAGSYSVSVSAENPWGRHTSLRCPEVLVVDNGAPPCPQVEVSLVSHPENAPLEVTRSVGATFSPQSTLSCDQSVQASVTYDWKVEKWDDIRKVGYCTPHTNESEEKI